MIAEIYTIPLERHNIKEDFEEGTKHDRALQVLIEVLNNISALCLTKMLNLQCEINLKNKITCVSLLENYKTALTRQI